MALTLDGLTVDLPENWSQMVMKEGFESSVVGQLTNQVPVSTRGNVIPIYDGGFEVGYVAEASPKPVSDVGFHLEYLTPQKFAGIAVVSKELARENPADLLSFLRRDMVNSVARQIDFGIFYGKSANTGAPVPNVTSVASTSNEVVLAPGDLVPQILAGYDLATEDNTNDPNGFAFDRRMRTRISLASQQQLSAPGGTSPMPNLNQTVGNFAGLPVAYGRSVAGKIGANPDTGVKGFLGDWEKLRWGFSENISMQRSDQATVVQGEKTWHLFQDNMIAFLVEFEAGWWVDPSAFTKYTGTATGATDDPAGGA